ncbi:DUF1275 family protein [Streptomyces sp. NPDC002888]|uniref:DUF1275 family protein n=1 Tax=Streptomyces sp. NPDC002888 TaxID=3364668 RepID=UPI0036BF73C7
MTSGNVVFSGFALAGAAGFTLTASLAALATFAVGALLGGRLAHGARAHRGRVLHLALLETSLVLVAYVIAEAAATPYASTVQYSLIALLGLAMGVQNAAARALAVPDLTTTVLTLTITGVAAASRAAGGKGGKAGRRSLSAAAMFTGGLAGAVAVLHGGSALPLLFATLLLAAATVTAFTLTRSDATWTKPL